MTRCLVAGEEKIVAGKAAAELLVEDNTQRGIMHTQFVVIFNKAELPEFVHEEIHAWLPLGCMESLLGVLDQRPLSAALYTKRSSFDLYIRLIRSQSDQVRARCTVIP